MARRVDGPSGKTTTGRLTRGPWNWQWRHRRRRRLTGCLLWLITLLFALLVLSLLFGGFHKGTRTGGAPPVRPLVTSTAGVQIGTG
jgi:hypothetical protein